MTHRNGGGLVLILACMAGVPVACSGRVASTGGDGGTSISSSGSGSSGGITSSSGSGSGGASSGSTSGSGGSSGGVTCRGDCCAQLPATACIVPPPPPTGPKTNVTTPHHYAVRHVFLGDVDRMNVENPDAWKGFGYNIDGKITTAASTDVCSLAPGAAKSVQVDGPGGIDNSWGENIVPMLQAFESTPTANANTAIQEGGPTQLIYVAGFDDSAGNQTTATGLLGVALAGARYPSNPPWNLDTHWPIAPEYINGCTPAGGCPPGTDPIQQAQVRFPAAFQTNGTFVSGAPGDLTLSMPLGGQLLALNLHVAIVTFDPGMPGQVTHGTIAGVMDTMEFVKEFQAYAGTISTSLCMGSAYQTIASEIIQMSDMALSGSQVSNEPGAQCNAISIGIGFDATEIALPTPADIAGPQPPPPDPCASGG